MNFDEIKKEITNNDLHSAYIKLKKVLTADPKNIEALYLTAIVEDAFGNYKNAITHYKKLIKEQKNYIFYDNLGTIYLKLSEYSKARVFFDLSIKINPDNADTCSKIGICLAMLNHEVDAINSFTKALKIKPSLLDALYNILDIYEKTNKKSELNKLVNDKIKIYPFNQILLFYKSFEQEDKNGLEEAINSLKNLDLSNENLNSHAKKQWDIKISFRMAYLLHKSKKYKDAFQNYSLGNKLVLDNLDNDKILKNIFNAKLDKCLEFSTKKLPDQNLKNISNYNLVFHIGFPRSGTTLVDAILSAHSKITVLEETPIVENMFQLDNFNILDDISSKSQEIYNNFYEKELKKYTKSHLNKKHIIIDKLPLNLIWIRHLSLIFPNSKFIISLRHPLDCILSCYTQNFVLNPAMVNFLDLNKTAHIYNNAMQIIYNNISKISNKFYFLKYEDLILDFNDNVHNLINFMNLNWEENISNYKEKAINKDRIRTPSYNQVVMPIYHHAINKWENYRDQLNPILPLVKDWIKYFNYKI